MNWINALFTLDCCQPKAKTRVCIFLATDYVLSIGVVSRKKLTNYSRMWGE